MTAQPPPTAPLYEVCLSNDCQPTCGWFSLPPRTPRAWRTSHNWPTASWRPLPRLSTMSEVSVIPPRHNLHNDGSQQTTSPFRQSTTLPLLPTAPDLSHSTSDYPEPNSWMDSLPLVLLGIRSAFKEDVGCTAAELVYGTTLRLPGEFFDQSTNDQMSDQTTYAKQLKSVMRGLQAAPTRQPQHRQTYISMDLTACTHVFVRHDAVRKPLQPPYDGPFLVVKRSPKFYTIDYNGKPTTISLDHLKPVHLDSTLSDSQQQPLRTSPLPSSSSPPSPPTRTTRSGRHVHWPNYLAHYI